MNRWLSIPYRAAGFIAELATRATTTTGTSKLARSFAIRHDAVRSMEAWGETARDPNRPLVWFHAASVGEGLMAQPLIERLRLKIPAVQLAYTYFSPSAAEFARDVGVDFASALPFDTGEAAERALLALRPTAIVFVKGDVWPLLTESASKFGVRTALVSASIPEDSARTHSIGRALTRDAFSALDAVGAASTADADAAVRAGARRERVSVTGDTRYDQAWARAHESPRNADVISRLRSQRTTIVAGSTWREDENVLANAYATLRKTVPDLRLIIAPHEPNRDAMQSLRGALAISNVTVASLSQADVNTDVIIIDRVGLLADLYALADVAYVGGGFGSAGLHSVVEPAVFGVRTITGPHIERSRDARMLEQEGPLTVVRDANEFVAQFPQSLERSAVPFETVTRERGAVERSLALVTSLV